MRLDYRGKGASSINPDLEELQQLRAELGQVTYSIGTSGKVLINKTPPATRSPNLGDAMVMAFVPIVTEGRFFTAPAPPGDAVITAAPAAASEINLPVRCDAIVATAVCGIDCIATVILALTIVHDTWPPGVVVDWDLRPIEGAVLDGWLAAVFERLDELRRELQPRGGVGLSLDPGNAGVELYAQAQQQQFLVDLVPEDLTKLELVQRAVSASSYVRGGKVVFSRHAREQVMEFRGAVRNHLLDATAKFSGAK